MAELMEYLEQAVADKASDLFIVAGSTVSEKAEGDIRPISEGKKLPPDTEQLICAIYALAERSMGTTAPPVMAISRSRCADWRVSASMRTASAARWRQWCAWWRSRYPTGGRSVYPGR